MKKILLGLACFAVIVGSLVTYNVLNVASNQCISGRGCCSSHGGVCGCKNGRSQCCDGTLSPSCQCFRDDVKGFEI